MFMLMAIKGANQGQFKGQTGFPGHPGEDKWLEILSFTMGVSRDSAGDIHRARHFEPITIVKDWAAASAQGLTACATNEVLTEVVIEFYSPDPTGITTLHQIIQLTNALITDIARFKGDPEDAWHAGYQTGGVPSVERERWSFTFHDIKLQDLYQDTTFAETWSGLREITG